MASDLTAASTGELIRRISGNPRADEVGPIVAELIGRNQERAYSLALRLCRGNRSLADEVFQETFVRMFPWLQKNGSRVRDEGFGSLLAVFVRRAAIDAMRRELRHVPSGTEAEAQAIPAPSGEPSAEAREDIGRLLAGLAPRARLILEFSLGGLGAAEIAELLRLTPSHVRLLRHRAIASLRAKVAASGDKFFGGL